MNESGSPALQVTVHRVGLFLARRAAGSASLAQAGTSILKPASAVSLCRRWPLVAFKYRDIRVILKFAPFKFSNPFVTATPALSVANKSIID